MRWLVPGGHLALLWSNTPWIGNQQWQRVMADRVPENLYQHLAEEPHTKILGDTWTIEKLTGFMYSTSVLSQQALGRNVHEFESDLRERLLAVEPEGVFREEISFSYTLASRLPSNADPALDVW